MKYESQISVAASPVCLARRVAFVSTYQATMTTCMAADVSRPQGFMAAKSLYSLQRSPAGALWPRQMTSTFPFPGFLQPQICFVHKGGALQGVVGTFAAHVMMMRQTAKLVITEAERRAKSHRRPRSTETAAD